MAVPRPDGYGPASMPLLAAASGQLPTLVLDIGLALVAAGILAAVFARLRITPIAAFLVAGVLLGPVGGLISNRADIETIAELGLIMLLFLIGLEFDVRALAKGGRVVAVSGLLQFPLTAAFGFLVAQGLVVLGAGAGIISGRHAALYLGVAIATSSTLLVVSLLQRSYALDTMSGRMAVALLVFQDVWAIAVLAIQPSLDQPRIGLLAASLGGIVLLAVLAVAVGHTVLRRGFAWVAKQPGLLFLASLAWCFLVVIAGVNIDEAFIRTFDVDPGMSVGAGMGALIAGTTIASLPFRDEIARHVTVVHEFFVTLFFVGIGMTIPARGGAGIVAAAVVLAAVAVAARFVIVLPLLHLSGLDPRSAATTSGRLVPISEFALVIAFIGVHLGHVSEEVGAVIVFGFIITAVASPWLFARADRAYERLEPILRRLGMRAPEAPAEAPEAHYDVAILGVHRAASSLLAEMSASTPDLLTRTVVVDFNVATHREISELGATVVYGDFTVPETLHNAGVDRARVVVCAIPGDVLASSSPSELVATVRDMCPDAVVIATAITFPEAEVLYRAGADYVLLPRVDAGASALTAIREALGGRLGRLRRATDERLADKRRREVMD
jgi:Kef-type K+ transport system membrane component KefB